MLAGFELSKVRASRFVDIFAFLFPLELRVTISKRNLCISSLWWFEDVLS